MRLVLLIMVASLGCGDVVPSDANAKCFDGLDNEGAPDELVDCADPGCGAVATCVASAENPGIVVGANDPCPAGYGRDAAAPGAASGCVRRVRM